MDDGQLLRGGGGVAEFPNRSSIQSQEAKLEDFILECVKLGVQGVTLQEGRRGGCSLNKFFIYV